MLYTSRISFTALLLLMLGVVRASNFQIKVLKYATECFYEQLTHGDRLEISYEVTGTTGQESDIDFLITNPDGSILHQVDRHREAAFGFYAGSTGKHEMCFINKNSYADKVLAFSFIGPDDQAVVNAPVDASQEEILLSQAIQTLSNDIRFMKDEISYLNRRIDRHSQTAKSTFSRVFYWSLFQILIVAGVVGFQITYLRGIFEKKRLI